MNSEPLPLVLNQKTMLTRTKTKMALLTVVGGLTYVVVNSAVNPSYTSALGLLTSAMVASTQPATAAAAQPMVANNAVPGSDVSKITTSPTQSIVSQGVPSPAAPTRVGAGAKIYPANPAVQIPPLLYQVPGNKQDGSNAEMVKSKMAYSPSGLETTHVIEPTEKMIPLLGPVARESGRSAVVVPPFLMCTVEILEHGVLVSHQTMGCTQSGGGERLPMLMEFGQEVPNEIPNMKYWLSVQVDGYRQGYPILHTRMEMTGLLGRTVGRRKYESVTVVEPNKKQTMIAFNIDDDDFAVTISAQK